MSPDRLEQADGGVIVAAISPPGRGAVAVLRLSGEAAQVVARGLCPGGPAWVPRRASLRQALDAEGRHLDELLAVWMPGPRSYTGEDVVELSCHGNPHIVAALEARCLELGARLARPGEFTRRAVEHGRMDLIGAEAVLARIEAEGAGALAVAREARSGQLSAVLEGLRERALDLAAELEAHLDHPDEDLAHHGEAEVVERLRGLSAEAGALAGSWTVQKRRLHGARVALCGPVNAGKSSLLNALVGERRALVSEEAGTTRDVVSAPLELGELTVWLLDTAGLGEAGSALEAEGQRLGQEQAQEADLLLWLSSLVHPVPPPEAGFVWVGTHLDRVPADQAFDGRLQISNTTGAGLDELRALLREALLGRPTRGEEARVFSLRQAGLCRTFAGHLDAAAEAVEIGVGAAVAVSEVVLGLEQLDELLGRDAGEALLDRLFSRFCIGK